VGGADQAEVLVVGAEAPGVERHRRRDQPAAEVEHQRDEAERPGLREQAARW
jgi:hypothetical protein